MATGREPDDFPMMATRLTRQHVAPARSVPSTSDVPGAAGPDAQQARACAPPRPQTRAHPIRDGRNV